MNTNGFKIGQIVSVRPFGESPVHYCRIEKFEETSYGVFARGNWYSKQGNRISGAGFEVRVIKIAKEINLKEAEYKYKSKYIGVK